MRIKITLSSDKPGIVDFNYQHQIQALIYGFLSRSDPDYSEWLHHRGFVYKKDKRFKLFVFSGILFHIPVKIIRPGDNSYSPGGFSFRASSSNPFLFSFQIASPVDQFIQYLVDGIFSKGQAVKLGRSIFHVYLVETLPDPLRNLNSSDNFNGSGDTRSSFHNNTLSPNSNTPTLFSGGESNRVISIALRPLESPIFIKKPMPPGQQDIFLYPGDEGYEEFLGQNLIHKYETLYGKLFGGESLKFTFHPVSGKSIKQFTVFSTGSDGSVRPINLKGTLQPFTITGPKELIEIGLECGFGQNNSMGCGYVEAIKTVQAI